MKKHCKCLDIITVYIKDYVIIIIIWLIIKGKELKPDDVPWVDRPEDLIGQEAHFLFKVASGRGLPKKFTVS